MRRLNFVVSLFTSSVRTRLSLQLEIAALRHQLSVYQCERRRPFIGQADRLLWSIVARFWSDWRLALCFVQPRTVMVWQRKRFCDHWRALSQQAYVGRPRIAPELRHLKQLLSSYLDYYHPWRPHQCLKRDAPDGRPICSAKPGQVIARPAVHGLHHYYIPVAA